MDASESVRQGGGGPGTAAHNTVRIYLVDGSPITRMGIQAIIEPVRELEIVGTSPDGGIDVEFIQRLDPDVVIVNSLSLSAQWPEPIAGLCGRSSGLPQRILLIVGEHENAVSRRARADADGIVLLQARPAQFVAAINLVAAGYSVDLPGQQPEPSAAVPQAGRPARAPRWSAVRALTRRELDVLRAVAQGRTNAEIARMMTVSESTVKSHVQNLLAKLGLPNRASAVALAYEAGMLSGD